jgi:hypothetical protein
MHASHSSAKQKIIHSKVTFLFIHRNIIYGHTKLPGGGGAGGAGGAGGGNSSRSPCGWAEVMCYFLYITLT